jgi:hypothetical protein
MNFDLELEDKLHDKQQWGRWIFNANNLTLVQSENTWYEIDLETITDSAEMLDWIFQMAQKSWVSTEDLGNLIRGFEDLFSPQANLCSGGRNKQFNPTVYLKGRLAASK